MRTRLTNITLCPGVTPESASIPLIPQAEVLIEDGLIVFAGKRDQAPPFEADTTVDGRGQLCMPGLCNAHTHAAMSLMRGIGSDLNLQDWLEGYVYPTEARLTERAARVGNRLAQLEMLRFGVTSYADMYMMPHIAAQTVRDCGMRASIVNATVDFGNGERQLADALEFYHAYDGFANGRVRAAIGPHAEYTNTTALIERMVAAIEDIPCTVHLHLSETRGEVERCVAKYGKSPVRYFHDLGLFRHQTLAAHCVAVSPEDMDILAADGVFAVHNPVSNLKLASGVAPVPEMLKRGVRVALGTDSDASNNNLSLMEEIKLMAILHKGVTGDPTVVPAHQALLSACLRGAQAMGFERVGLLREGWHADLILLDTALPHMRPLHSLGTNLCYSATGSDVTLTMVDGRVLYKDGAYLTLDREAILREAEELEYVRP